MSQNDKMLTHNIVRPVAVWTTSCSLGMKGTMGHGKKSSVFVCFNWLWNGSFVSRRKYSCVWGGKILLILTMRSKIRHCLHSRRKSVCVFKCVRERTSVCTVCVCVCLGSVNLRELGLVYGTQRPVLSHGFFSGWDSVFICEDVMLCSFFFFFFYQW